jgi:hypothetical protein
MLTLVVLICHLIEGISSPICHEEIVAKAEIAMMACQTGNQPIIAQWKADSIYRGDQWVITEIWCKPGDYQPRDAI